MKPLALAVVLFCAPALVAQEKPPAENRPEQPTETQGYSRATPAPQLGHPLDPADVAVLTGKTKEPANAGYRVDPLSYAYGSYSGYLGIEGTGRGQRYTGFSPRTSLLFARTRRGSFFFLGNSPFSAPPPFFFGRGRGGFFLF
jgi:hypothetical protein